MSLFSGLTSIIPFSRDWQSGGMKWGMWNTPLFTFSRSWRKLSWSKGRAPCRAERERDKNKKGTKKQIALKKKKHWQAWDVRKNCKKHKTRGFKKRPKCTVKTQVKDLPPVGQTEWPHSSTHLLSAHHTSPPAKHTNTYDFIHRRPFQYKSGSQNLAPVTGWFRLISGWKTLKGTLKSI